MSNSLLKILAVLGVAVALSGCVVVPWHPHNGGGSGYSGGGGHYHNGY